MTEEYKDFPIIECVEQVSQRMKECQEQNIEMHVFQKWTCSHCNARQTMEEPNTFFTSGKCEECSQVTQIENCNYMATLSSFKEKETMQ